MNTLSIFNPALTSDLFDVFDEAMNVKYSKSVNQKLPAVDIAETKDSYLLEMELSGLSENDIELSIKERVLTIGTKKQDKKEPDEKSENQKSDNKSESKRYLLKERKNLSFTRSFTLPENINSENVSANFVNGLLTIVVPKKPEAEQKRILINVA